jgi:hypothetical protein
MTPTTMDTDLYRTAVSHQADLRNESARARAILGDRRSDESLAPTRSPLAALRRRLAGAASFA